MELSQATEPIEPLDSAVVRLEQLPNPRQNNLWFHESNTDAALVFVHGVLSNSRECWLNDDDPNRRVYWPDLITKDPSFFDIGIFLGGYATSVDSGSLEIRHCADELHTGMKLTGAMKKDKLTFVCHSAGGLVVRYLLADKPELFAKKEIGLVLIASPSHGSHLANKLGWLIRFYRHELGEQLKWGERSVRDLDARFKNLLDRDGIPRLHGREACEHRFILHNKWIPIFRTTRVVREESAGQYFGAARILPNTDHSSVVKPRDRSHAAYTLLQEFFHDHPSLLPASSPEDPEEPSVPADRVVELVDSLRPNVLDMVGPTYLLDPQYHFLDWNPAFDELIAKPLHLARGRHADTLIRRLENIKEVMAHSMVLRTRTPPLIDMETLEVKTEKFGLTKYRKIASQITDDEGRTKAWCINLDIIEDGNTEAVQEALRARMESEINWSKYAHSYDELLLAFPEYIKLRNRVVGAVADRLRCVDLGAGTGNTTFRLLDENPNREVSAIEGNESMIRYFRQKQAARAKDGKDDADRLILLKGNVTYLDRLPQNAFDAAVMVNVLYALQPEDKPRCISEVFKVLKPGGVFICTTSHSKTDVTRLFQKLEGRLREAGRYDQLALAFKNARDSNLHMMKKIRADSKKSLRSMFEKAGFTVETMDHDYVDSVLFIKAFKSAV